jgi:Flp pilus assembly protein TadG
MADRVRDGGTATAELAVAVPAVGILLGAVIAVGQATIAQVRVVDAARAGARAAARGDDVGAVRRVAGNAAGRSGAPASVTVATGGSTVRITVSRPVRLLLPHGPTVQVTASAVAQREQGQHDVH